MLPSTRPSERGASLQGQQGKQAYTCVKCAGHLQESMHKACCCRTYRVPLSTRHSDKGASVQSKCVRDCTGVFVSVACAGPLLELTGHCVPNNLQRRVLQCGTRVVE